MGGFLCTLHRSVRESWEFVFVHYTVQSMSHGRCFLYIAPVSLWVMGCFFCTLHRRVMGVCFCTLHRSVYESGEFVFVHYIIQSVSRGSLFLYITSFSRWVGGVCFCTLHHFSLWVMGGFFYITPFSLSHCSYVTPFSLWVMGVLLHHSVCES